jgi:hypothetical protein
MADYATESIELSTITPLHPGKNERQLKTLAESLAREGWHGRPLLVIEREDDYLAWTGSHRIAAAKLAGFKTVPCYVLQEAQLTEKGFDAEHGQVFDSDRLEILRKVGDETAIHIMWFEGRDN